jgi:hypothetical protein
MRLPKTIIPAAILLTLAVPAAHAEKSAKKPAHSKARPQAAQQAPAQQAPAQKAPAQQATAADTFAAMDTDHDGKITRAEWKGNAIGFAMLDRNGDGVLSGDELKPAGQTPAQGAPAARPPR